MISPGRKHSMVDPSQLTQRQQQIVSLVQIGLSNKEIARRLTISEGTVKQHLVAIFRLLKVNNRTQAAQLGQSQHLSAAPLPPDKATLAQPSAHYVSSMQPVSCLTVRIDAMGRLLHRLGSSSYDQLHRTLRHWCQRAAHRYEGVVQSFPGGIFIVFGIPRLREDDAERAYCAARMVRQGVLQEMGETVFQDLPIRLCVITRTVATYFDGGRTSVLGELLTHACGEEGCGIHTPLRLCISNASMDSLAFLAQRHGPLSTILFSDTEMAIPEGASWSSQPLFTGRSNDMQELRQRIEQAKQGHSKALVVLGEAGFGKSRLVEALRQKSGEITWLTGSCRSVARDHAFYPFIPMLDALAGLAQPVSPAARHQGLNHWIHTLPADLQPSARAFLPLLTEPVPGAADQFHQWLEVACEFLPGVFQLIKRPGVIFVDNLQWADDFTRHVIPRLVPMLNGTHLLFLGAGRRSELRLVHTLPGVETLSLRRLPLKEMVNLLKSMGAGDCMASARVEKLASWCGGVPLFAVETARGCLNHDFADTMENMCENNMLPEDLLGLVLERLDSAGVDWRVVRAVAVTGRIALSRLLAMNLHEQAATTRESVDHLLRLGVLVEEMDILTFANQVVRAAVWQTLPHGDRADPQK